MNYSTIQEAINANETLDGQTIFVDEGTYDENVVVNKTLSIVGQNPSTTIVDGGQGDYAIMVVASNVTVEGFTVISSRHMESGTNRDSVRFASVQNCSITSNIITAGDVGIELDSSLNNDISQNNITGVLWPMWFDYSSANSIYDNQISNSLFITDLLSSNENVFFNNTFTDNGISLSPRCYGNIIKANTITDSYPLPLPPIGVYLGDETWERDQYWGFVENDTVIDNTFVNSGVFADSAYGNTVENNTVNGAPIVYLEGASDLNITGAGQVILINCSRMEIENSLFHDTCVGVELRESQNVQVEGNNLTADDTGILFYGSSNNTVSENTIANSPRYGIELQGDSNNNRICHNNLIGNALGGDVWAYQVYVESSSGNTPSGNTLDNGYPSGGNFWSDYNGTDVFSGVYQNTSGSDGIGDTAYVTDAGNVIDHYPLMGMFNSFNATPQYSVQTVCNSTISDFQFNGTALLFNVTGENGTTGFCRVSFPAALLNGTLTVFVNGTEVPYTLLPESNSTESYLYFTYSHSTEQVTIMPEFPSLSILSLFMIMLIALAFCKRKAHAPD